jgi:hypothetical protein
MSKVPDHTIYDRVTNSMENGVFWDVMPCGSSETSVLIRATWFTSQKTPFFIITAVKTSNLT